MGTNGHLFPTCQDSHKDLTINSKLLSQFGVNGLASLFHSALCLDRSCVWKQLSQWSSTSWCWDPWMQFPMWWRPPYHKHIFVATSNCNFASIIKHNVYLCFPHGLRWTMCKGLRPTGWETLSYRQFIWPRLSLLCPSLIMRQHKNYLVTFWGCR